MNGTHLLYYSFIRCNFLYAKRENVGPTVIYFHKLSLYFNNVIAKYFVKNNDEIFLQLFQCAMNIQPHTTQQKWQQFCGKVSAFTTANYCY